MTIDHTKALEAARRIEDPDVDTGTIYFVADAKRCARALLAEAPLLSVENASPRCLLCDEEMPPWSRTNVCFKHPSGVLGNSRLDETKPAVGGSTASGGGIEREGQSAMAGPVRAVRDAPAMAEKIRKVLAAYPYADPNPWPLDLLREAADVLNEVANG